MTGASVSAPTIAHVPQLMMAELGKPDEARKADAVSCSQTVAAGKPVVPSSRLNASDVLPSILPGAAMGAKICFGLENFFKIPGCQLLVEKSNIWLTDAIVNSVFLIPVI